jgi:hypothetical protein
MIQNALPSAPPGSSPYFHVNDTNVGLESDTHRGVTMPVGSDLQPEDVLRWVPCEDKRVRFFTTQDICSSRGATSMTGMRFCLSLFSTLAETS